MVDTKAEPPEEAAYHLMVDPVAFKLAMVAPVQTDCEALPVGADGAAFTVIVTKSVNSKLQLAHVLVPATQTAALLVFTNVPLWIKTPRRCNHQFVPVQLGKFNWHHHRPG